MLLLDEPFGALDAFTREELWCAMRDLQARKVQRHPGHATCAKRVPADTVYVMSKAARAHPGQTADRPARPRDLEITYTPRFTDIVHELRGRIGARPKNRRQAGGRRHGGAAPFDEIRASALRRWSCWWPSWRWAADLPPSTSSEFIFPARRAGVEQTWPSIRATIIRHAWRTFWVTMIGFGLAIVVGVLLGFLMGSSRLAYKAMYPLMVAFNALPKGGLHADPGGLVRHRHRPAIPPPSLISFFPIAVNIATGLATLEPGWKTCCACWAPSRWDVLHQGGPAALDALLLRLAQGGHHAGLRRHHGVGDDGQQRASATC